MVFDNKDSLDIAIVAINEKLQNFILFSSFYTTMNICLLLLTFPPSSNLPFHQVLNLNMYDLYRNIYPLLPT